LKRRFYTLLEIYEKSSNLIAFSESIALPVYLLRFAFDYQFNESFEAQYEEDLCIFPEDVILEGASE
jgi:hypothetical protein